jgi:hypothetical protein
MGRYPTAQSLSEGKTVTDKARKDKKVDRAGDMSFPASDAPAHGRTTATEPPGRPVDRKAPVVTKDEIERAKRSEGHKN